MTCTACQKASAGEPGYTLQTGCLCRAGSSDFFVPTSTAQTLVSKLTPTVDALRNLQAKLGARDVVVRLIWTRWTGGKRGHGEEYVFREVALTPIPQIADVSKLDRQATAIGAIESGNLEISEISPRYTEGELLGLIDEKPPGLDVNFYWELEHVHPTGGKPIRRRFFPVGPPNHDPVAFEWRITLVRAQADRTPEGMPRGVP